MGIFRMGPPEDLVIYLRDTSNIEQFIETGTYQGNTAAWASKYFKNVITIENSEKYYAISKQYLSQFQNVKIIKGDSRQILSQILNKNMKPAIFWLDAHFCCDAYGESDECPLLEEITEIGKSSNNHILFIDDARLFLAPPPKPHNPDQWPHILEIFELLENNGQYTVILEDVIISVPKFMKQILVSGVQSYLSRDNNGKKGFVETLIDFFKKIIQCFF